MESALLLLLLVLCMISSPTVLQVKASASGNRSALLESLDIPATIEVPPGQKLHVVYYAKGLVHYSFNGSAWVLFNATADLYALQHKVSGRKVGGGHKKQVVGEHFFIAHPDAAGGQPSWETFKPAWSLVTARLISQITVDPNSITWALFEATADSGDVDLLGAVTYLQRVDAKGGLPPSITLGAQVGEVHVTPYSIIYIFYTKAS